MIVTERLTLSPFYNATSVSHQVRWLNDPDIVRYSEQRFKKHTLKSQLAYAASFDWPDLFMEIRFKKPENELEALPIGTVTAFVDRNNNIADLGLLIGAKTQWGKGLGTEAWVGVRDYLFKTLKIRKIEAGMMHLNMGMIGVCLKSGMKEEGRRLAHFSLDGTYCDLVMYGQFA